MEIRKPRVALQGSVWVTPTGEPRVLEFMNLSTGGLFVKTATPLEVGSVVDLELPILRVPFKARATVAWIRPYDSEPKTWGMGLGFLELSTVQRKTLHRQINEALELGGEEKPGTPPSPAQLAAGRSAKARPQKKRSLWSRLFRF